MKRKLLLFFLLSSVFISCGRKAYINTSGFERPVRKNIFSYSNRFTSLPKQIDTNAIYVHRCQFQTGGGSILGFSYLRFFSSGQVQYVESRSKLDLTHLNDFDKGYIGRYYFKNDKLHMQLFYNPGTFYSIVKFRGYFTGDTLFIRFTTSTHTPWCSTANLEDPLSFFEKKVFKWEKQNVIFKSNQTPNW